MRIIAYNQTTPTTMLNSRVKPPVVPSTRTTLPAPQFGRTPWWAVPLFIGLTGCSINPNNRLLGPVKQNQQMGMPTLPVSLLTETIKARVKSMYPIGSTPDSSLIHPNTLNLEEADSLIARMMQKTGITRVSKLSAPGNGSYTCLAENGDGDIVQVYVVTGKPPKNKKGLGAFFRSFSNKGNTNTLPSWISIKVINPGKKNLFLNAGAPGDGKIEVYDSKKDRYDVITIRKKSDVDNITKAFEQAEWDNSAHGQKAKRKAEKRKKRSKQKAGKRDKGKADTSYIAPNKQQATRAKHRTRQTRKLQVAGR